MREEGIDPAPPAPPRFAPAADSRLAALGVIVELEGSRRGRYSCPKANVEKVGAVIRAMRKETAIYLRSKAESKSLVKLPKGRI